MDIYFESSGKGSPTVVFTHGLAADHGTWRNQVEELSQRHRVVTWDLRGHGRSGSAPGACQLADLVGDLRTVLDRAGVERAVLVGHSAGGVVVMQFAVDHPERVAGLVLVGTASECNARGFEYYERLATLATEGRIAELRKQLGLRAAGENATPIDPGTFAVVARAMGHLHHEPLTAGLGAIGSPALILVGDKDPLGVGGSVILSRAIPDARLVIVPGRGHGLFLEDPVGFNRSVAELLDGLSDGGATKSPSPSKRGLS